MNIKIMIPCTI